MKYKKSLIGAALVNRAFEHNHDDRPYFSHCINDFMLYIRKTKRGYKLKLAISRRFGHGTNNLSREKYTHTHKRDESVRFVSQMYRELIPEYHKALEREQWYEKLEKTIQLPIDQNTEELIEAGVSQGYTDVYSDMERKDFDHWINVFNKRNEA